MTLTAPVESPWSWRSTLPPTGQEISQASNSGVRAISRHWRRSVSGAPAQCTAGARRLATSQGLTRADRQGDCAGARAADKPGRVDCKRAGGTIYERLDTKPD